MARRTLPWVLIALDGLGSALIVLGMLGMFEVDLGLPALPVIAPWLLVFGVLLALPFVAWLIGHARKRASGNQIR